MYIPKKLTSKIDKLYDLQQEMARAEAVLERTIEYKELERFKADYGELKNHILSQHTVEDLKNTSGKRASLVASGRDSYKITNWDKFVEFVQDNDAYDLFQRSVTITAVREREADGVRIPGLVKHTTFSIKPKGK